MTKEEEYARILDDLECAESDYDAMEDEMRELEMAGYSDGDGCWEALDYEMTQKQNEIAYLQSCLEDYE